MVVKNPPRIKAEHLDAIEKTANIIYLSSMSIAELMIKKSIDKLNFDFDILKVAADMEIEMLNFNGVDALQLETRPLYHKGDRLIA